MPEPWESASDEEWLEIQRQALYQFLFGEPEIRRAIGQTVGVEPPVIPPVEEEGGGGGLLGGIADVGWGALEALDLPRQYIGEPIYEAIETAGQAAAVPLRMAFRGESPEEAWGQAGEYEPSAYEKLLMSEMYNPINYIGFGLAGRGARALGMGQRGVRALTTAEDVMTGGPLLRGAAKPLARIPAPARIPIGGTAVGAGIGYGVTGEPSGALTGGAIGLGAGIGAEAGLAGLRGIGRAGARAVPEGMVATAAERPGAVPPRKPPIGEGIPPTEPPPTALGAAGEVPGKDPVDTLTELLRVAKPLRKSVENLKHKARQQQAAILGSIQERQPGLAGQIRQKGVLKGKLPDIEAEWAGFGLTDESWEELIKRAHTTPELKPFERFTAAEAIDKFRNTGDIPTFGEIALIERALGKPVADAMRKAKGWPARLWQEFWEIINMPRAILASFDLSAPLRQGAMLGPGHPKEWAANIAPMVRAFADEKFARQWYKRLTTGAMAERRKAAGLFVSEFGQDALTLAREEMYITKYAHYFPLLKQSERSYAMYLNGLRADIFDNVVRGWDDLVRTGKWTSEELLTRERQLAGFLNAASGRGTLGPLKKWGQVLSGGFFSPRLVISRIEAPVRVAASLGTPGVRKELAKDLIAFVGTGVGILSLLKWSGLADVETDPRSSDFGKIKLGPTRIDFWAGYQPIARYTAQLMKGERKTIGTGDIFPVDRKEVVLRFIQSKLSPQAGALVDLTRGETYMGEQMAGTMDVGQREAFNRLVPLFIQDMVEAGKMEGIPGMLKVAPAGLGMGAQTFETPGEKIMRVSEQEAGVDWREQGAIERMRLEERHPEIGEARQEQLEAAAKWGKGEALELRQQDAKFEEDFKGLMSRDVTYQQLTDAYRNYLQERAASNQVRWAEKPDRDPRSDLERRTDAYDAIEYPSWGTPEEKDKYFDKRAAMLATDPGLAQAVRDRQLLRFKDPTVRQFIQRYQDAIEVRNEYYQIPRYQGLSVEEGREVQRFVNEAQAMVELGQALDRKTALMQMQQEGRITDFRLLMVAMNADRLRNQERRAFRQAHPEAFEMFEPIPMEAQPVGVS